MATEIDKLTRYALKSNATGSLIWIGRDDEAGTLLYRDGVINAVAAIEERHAREVTSIILALREFGRTSTGHLDGETPCRCEESGFLEGHHVHGCKNMPLKSASYVRDLVPIIEKLRELVEPKR